MKTNAKKLSGKDLDALFDLKPRLKTKEEIRREKIHKRVESLSTDNYTWVVPIFLIIILDCVILLFQYKKIFLDYNPLYNFWIGFIVFVILSIIHYITNTPKIDKYVELKEVE